MKKGTKIHLKYVYLYNNMQVFIWQLGKDARESFLCFDVHITVVQLYRWEN